MTKMIVRLLRHFLDLLQKELQKLINGLSGKERQEKQRLMQTLLHYKQTTTSSNAIWKKSSI